MVIKASAVRQVDALIADLASGQATVRDAAIARLTVIGTRAVERLAAVALDHAVAIRSRVSSLRALEGIDDARALDAGLRLVGDDDAQVAAAAVALVRNGLGGSRGVAAVDRLVSVALDATRPEAVREAAIHALGDLEFATLAPLLDALSSDTQPAIRAMAARLKAGERREPESATAVIEAAARGALPDHPDVLRKALGLGGAGAPLTELRQLVDVIREREEASPAHRDAWRHARAAVHVALARRGSWLAVFDLRETLAASDTTLPVEFVAALVAVGDASCLEPIAAAFHRSLGRGDRDAWWLRHLADAFQAIAARERLTRRHAVMKRIEKRWPDAFERLRARPSPQ